MQGYEGEPVEVDVVEVDVVEVDAVAVADDEDWPDTQAFDAEPTIVTTGAAVVAETVLLLEDAPALELPVWEPTGDAEVDAALEQLRLLDDAELADHVAVFTDVHAALHQRLSDIAGS